MAKLNVFWLLTRTPMSTGVRLRLRRQLMDLLSANDEYEGWQFDYMELEEDEHAYYSRQLLRRARQLRLPTAPLYVGQRLSEDYVQSALDGSRYFLSFAGEQKVRAAIREEEKFRSEKWARRIPYITALSGLVGTITGLVAVLQKWGS